jgi:uncharacterized protein (UPF0332 family)
MSVSPNELLLLADAVLRSAKTEAEWRNAVGRAYYAVYHAATNFHNSLPSRGRTPPKQTGVHEELAFRLTWPNLPTDDPKFEISRTLGRNLRWLSSKRVEADYYLNKPFSEADAREVVDRARAAFELIK